MQDGEKMKNLQKFIKQFTSKKVIDERNLYVIENKFFMLNEKLANIIIKSGKRPFYEGVYIGKSKGYKFFPSFALLQRIATYTTNKIWVDATTEWLFVCGRDIFAKGIIKSTGHKEKGGISLIFNQHNELLGFGKIVKKLDKKEVVVTNILDV
jgi:ribosome biogenesis protein Nip4